MLHGSTVTDLENQTVVITSTPLKARHHKYQEGFTIIRQLKKNMGYKNIFHMTPDRHDKIMSNIQFLTHSMLLTLGGAIMNNGYQVDSNNIDSIKSDIIVLLNRMKNQPSHVYKGIAEGNIFNAGVVYALQKIVDQLPNEMCFDESLGFFREFVNKNNLQLGINNKERRQISTPMSRARDGIILKSTDMKDDYKVDLKSSLINYLQALNNNGYETYFSEIMCQVDEQLQRSNCYFNDAKVIRRYGEIILNK